MSPGSTLAERTISAFPVSVGTSLALESLFKGSLEPIDPERKISYVDHSNYSEIWINLSTLYRNLVGAASKQAFIESSEKQLLEALMSEIEIITDLFNIEGGGLCKPRFYRIEYLELIAQAKANKIKLREANTVSQKTYQYKHDNVLAMLSKQTDSISFFKDELNPEQDSKALVITHIPFDLLSYAHFNTLHLLESHTGTLKPRSKWNSKYFPYADQSLGHMPFNKMLLYVFGDKVQISPAQMKLRESIFECSKKRNWNPLTTMAKIHQDLSLEIKEPFVLAWLKAIR